MLSYGHTALIKQARGQNRLFQKASLLMCFCSFATGQLYTLKIQYVRYDIELLFKVQISPDHPKRNTNESDVLRRSPKLRTFQYFQWKFPLQIVTIFLSNRLEFFTYDLKLSHTIGEVQKSTEERVQM